MRRIALNLPSPSHLHAAETRVAKVDEEDGDELSDEEDFTHDVGVGEGDINEDLITYEARKASDRRASMAAGGAPTAGSERRGTIAARRGSLVAIRRGSLVALKGGNASAEELKTTKVSPPKKVEPKRPSVFHAPPNAVFADDSDDGYETEEEEEKLRRAQQLIDAQIKASVDSTPRRSSRRQHRTGSADATTDAARQGGSNDGEPDHEPAPSPRTPQIAPKPPLRPSPSFARANSTKGVGDARV